jgi:hypothetical protein
MADFSEAKETRHEDLGEMFRRLAIRAFPCPLKTSYAVFKKDGGKLLSLPRIDSTAKHHPHTAQLPASPETYHLRTNQFGAVSLFRSAQLGLTTVKDSGLGPLRRMGNG